MIPLFTEQEFQQASNQTKLPLQCKQCGQTFLKTKHRLSHSYLVHRPNDTSDFCSIRCSNQSRDTRKKLSCDNCGSTFVRNRTQTSGSARHFCTQSCAATYNNRHKTHGTRVSKLEQWLQVELPTRFPKLEWRFNEKTTIGSELDIFCPTLKLAVELNGIYHYKPIYGERKLQQIQANDAHKAEICKLAGIALHAIDTSRIKSFTHRTSEEVLAKIGDLITELKK
jgi:very-short-patch-repair endonuclease